MIAVVLIAVIMLLPPAMIALTFWLGNRNVPVPVTGTAKERATQHWNYDLGYPES